MRKKHMVFSMVCIGILFAGLWRAYAKDLSKSQRSELYHIYNQNDVTALQKMLDNGLDVNADMGGGVTLLIKAANIGTAGIVKLLLSRGADVNRKLKSGETALMSALNNSSHYAAIVPLLLEAGADVHVTNKRNGYNPVWQACSRIKRDNPDGPGFGVMLMLLQKGAEPNAKFISKDTRFNGMTPLMHFAKKGFKHTVKLLLDFKADKSARTDTGQTAMDFANAKHHRNVADLLAKWDPHQADAKAYALRKAVSAKVERDPETIWKSCQGKPREPWCYQEAVEQIGDASLCEPILKYWPQAIGVHGWCYYQLAVKQHDCKLCEKIRKQDIKKTCRLDACRKK